MGHELVVGNVNVNTVLDPSTGHTALTLAAASGHYRFVELLLSRGAQVDWRNKKGNSSLWLAANGGHLDVVQLLHSAGADIDSQDNRKVSCLMSAFRKGHSKVVKWLVKHVTQFPSDTELTQFIATISDKDMIKKTHQCLEIIRVAKERQASEVNNSDEEEKKNCSKFKGKWTKCATKNSKCYTVGNSLLVQSATLKMVNTEHCGWLFRRGSKLEECVEVTEELLKSTHGVKMIIIHGLQNNITEKKDETEEDISKWLQNIFKKIEEMMFAFNVHISLSEVDYAPRLRRECGGWDLLLRINNKGM